MEKITNQQEGKKMILTGKEAQQVVYEDHEGWTAETDEETIGHNRWSIHKSQVFKHIVSGKFYEFGWTVGATEYQDEQAFEHDKTYKPIEVEKWLPVEVGEK